MTLRSDPTRRHLAASLVREARALAADRRWLQLIIWLRLLDTEELVLVCRRIAVFKLPKTFRGKGRYRERPISKLPLWVRSLPPSVQAVMMGRIWPKRFRDPVPFGEPEMITSIEEAVEVYGKRILAEQRIYHPSDLNVRTDAKPSQSGPTGQYQEQYESLGKWKKRRRAKDVHKAPRSGREANDAQLVHDFMNNDAVWYWWEEIQRSRSKRAKERTPSAVDPIGTSEVPSPSSSAPVVAPSSRTKDPRSSAKSRNPGRRK